MHFFKKQVPPIDIGIPFKSLTFRPAWDRTHDFFLRGGDEELTLQAGPRKPVVFLQDGAPSR